jgi:acetyl-CoA carboxylase carboxyl transferase subunit beta
MGWFSRSSRKKKVPPDQADLWTVCPSCKAHVFKQKWQAAHKVCPKCNHHTRLTWEERRDLVFDPGSFRELHAEITTSDPLAFVDAKGSYADKAAGAVRKTGLKEAVVIGRAAIKSIPVVTGIMDFRFLGGSLGSGTGEKILRGAEAALRHHVPYIVFSASGGARMHEGIISLMQMAKTCAGIARLQRKGIPYFSVLTDPTTGGVSASFAMMGDLNIAEPRALIGFAGRRVIEQTIKQKLPEGFQTAEYLLEHGFVDRIVARSGMRDFLASALAYWKHK